MKIWHRLAVLGAAGLTECRLADPRVQPDRNPMPFEGKCMSCGGLETLLEG